MRNGLAMGHILAGKAAGLSTTVVTILGPTPSLSFHFSRGVPENRLASPCLLSHAQSFSPRPLNPPAQSGRGPENVRRWRRLLNLS